MLEGHGITHTDTHIRAYTNHSQPRQIRPPRALPLPLWISQTNVTRCFEIVSAVSHARAWQLNLVAASHALGSVAISFVVHETDDGDGGGGGGDGGVRREWHRLRVLVRRQQPALRAMCAGRSETRPTV